MAELNNTEQELKKVSLHDTLSRSLKEVVPVNDNLITMYNCGPTVYWKMQIGNIRAYTNWDILHRSLLYLGYDVKRSINFTDVGHMTSDENFGEDKMEKAALKEGRTPDEIADSYIQTVLDDFSRMNFLHPDGTPVKGDENIQNLSHQGWLRATSHINEMIEFIKKIEEHGFTYQTDQALYFDISKYDDYTRLSGQKLEDKLVGVREEVNIDPGAKSPADFVLWMKKSGRYANHIQHWNSPWGDGFPGWHIECSAMGTDALGDRITIHTGGIDHIPVHHPNERAQNYGVYGKEIVDIWLHNEFISAADGDKLSKSKGNAWHLDDVIEHGFDALDLRYYFGSINYGQPIKFSREGLDGAKNARLNLVEKLRDLLLGKDLNDGYVSEEFKDRFMDALANDLNVSKAFAIVHEILSSELDDLDKVATVLDFDKVLGLKLEEQVVNSLTQEVPQNVLDLVNKRKEAREAKDFQESDRLRDEIKDLGYNVIDNVEGISVKKI